MKNYCNKVSLFIFFISTLLAISLLYSVKTSAVPTYSISPNSATTLPESSNTIAIFYPESKEPYQSIYQEIIDGNEHAASELSGTFKVNKYVIRKDFDSDLIARNLSQNAISKVIVLGHLGWKLAKDLSKYKLDNNNKAFHIVSGAMPITPNGVSGVSLVTDPNYLFTYLGEVAPKVKRIHVAYSQANLWVIELAKLAAKQHGLTLNASLVSNTKEAIDFYLQLFESNITSDDAIWLPLDRIATNDKVTLPLILKKAWSKEVVVFSSKPSHAKRGALFSTYPDNFSLGKHLFTMVQNLDKQPEQKNFSPLKSTLLAVNLRTAAHLGFKYSAKQQKSFELTFPN